LSKTIAITEGTNKHNINDSLAARG